MESRLNESRILNQIQKAFSSHSVDFEEVNDGVDVILGIAHTNTVITMHHEMRKNNDTIDLVIQSSPLRIEPKDDATLLQLMSDFNQRQHEVKCYYDAKKESLTCISLLSETQLQLSLEQLYQTLRQIWRLHLDFFEKA